MNRPGRIDTSHLRRMVPSDIPQVAALQRRLLGESAVTQLGTGFLIRFYETALRCGACEAVVACEARGQIIGAALATADVAQFNGYVTPRIMLRLAADLIPRWRLAARFLRSPFEKKPARHVAAELLLLFVDGPYQDYGTGTRLVRAVEDAFARTGVTEYRVSVRSELRNALAFYAAKGFQHEDELIVLGRPMTYLTRRLGD